MDTGANQSELGSMYRFIVNSMVAEAAEADIDDSIKRKGIRVSLKTEC